MVLHGEKLGSGRYKVEQRLSSVCALAPVLQEPGTDILRPGLLSQEGIKASCELVGVVGVQQTCARTSGENRPAGSALPLPLCRWPPAFWAPGNAW